VTRSTPLKQTSGAADARAAATKLPEPAAMTFRIDKDNGGRYHWTIMADGRETLVRSASFGSYEQAKAAAGIVHRSASQASFEVRSDNAPTVDLFARRAAASHEDSDSERWLDEGGSFTRDRR
jgi:uncharacterized protein YegP (UPF0339 family)